MVLIPTGKVYYDVSNGSHLSSPSVMIPAVDPAFGRLRELRPLLLKSHQILMEAEKDHYESLYAPIATKGEYLHLVLHHEQFSWLRPISQLIVQIDEVLMAKQPQARERATELVRQTRYLLQATEIGEVFQARSQRSAQSNPEMAAIMIKLSELLQDSQS